MRDQTQIKQYFIRNSEKCFRFKPEAFMNHAPPANGIYELVHFDESLNPVVVYIGAAFDRTIKDCLESHADGRLQPSADQIMKDFPNLHFDFISETKNVKTIDDAQNVYWWLTQKYKPRFNELDRIKPTAAPDEFTVVEEQ